MTLSPAKCSNPQCRCPVQPEDVFCQHCGHPIADATDLKSRIVGGLGQNTFPVSSPITEDKAELSESDTNGYHLPVVAEAEQHSNIPLGASFPQSDCSDLEVHYNNKRIFVLNMLSTFNLKIIPKVDGIKKLFVEIQQNGQRVAYDAPMYLLRVGAVYSLHLNYKPSEAAGKAAFRIMLGYYIGEQKKVFAAFEEKLHTIHFRNENPRKVIEQLRIENTINGSNAADSKVTQNFDGMLNSLHQHNSLEIDRDFMSLIEKDPIWTFMPLAECDPGTVVISAPKKINPITRPQQVELKSDEGTKIYVTTQTKVRIGRNSKCEILGRVLDKAGQELRAPSLKISQFHAQIEWNHLDCRLKDGGNSDKGWQPSTHGVWVDGRRLPMGGEFNFISGQEYRISLGDYNDGPDNRFELSARLWSAKDLPESKSACQDAQLSPNSPVCLLLRRLTGPECNYLIVRSCAALAWADYRCGQSCVGLRQGVLHFCEGRTCELLVTGQVVHAGSLNFQVKEI